MSTKLRWTVGEIALAKVTKTFYAKVQIVKDENGLFHDEKFLGISTNEDGEFQHEMILCYCVEICRTKQCMWLPYTSLKLAERSRPFYGRNLEVPLPKSSIKSAVPKKREILEDIPLPVDVVQSNNKSRKLDLNISLELRQLPFRYDKRDNAFTEFVRRGKEMIFDEFFFLLQKDSSRHDDYDYVMNINASTEDKFETVIKGIVTYREIKVYLHQCWRYLTVTTVSKQFKIKDDAKNTTIKPIKALIHTNWCLVCGKREDLIQCEKCPSSFHQECKKLWDTTIRHRLIVKSSQSSEVTKVEKRFSSTRAITSSTKLEEPDICPSCMWGPRMGYEDIVWHKLGTCSWWPAKVLSPGTVPSCLLSRRHEPHEWPLKYYGTLNHSWADSSRMSLFLPSHTAVLNENRAAELQRGVLEACDDYICIYLT